MLEIFQELAQPPVLWAWGTTIAIGGFAALGGAALLTPHVQRLVLPELEEEVVGTQVQFEEVMDDGRTIVCYDGALVATISIGGADLEAVSGHVVHALEDARKTWLDQMGKASNVQMIVFSSRRQHDTSGNVNAYTQPIQRELQSRWHRQFRRSFRNGHTVVLWVPAGLANARRVLQEAVTETENRLVDFNPVVLKVGRPGEESPLHGFWASLLNPGRTVRVSAGNEASNVMDVIPTQDDVFSPTLSQAIAQSTILFNDGSQSSEDDGVVEFREGNDTCYMRAVSLAKYGAETSSSIVQRVMSIPNEVTLTQWIEPLEPLVARNVLEHLKRGSQMRPRRQQEVQRAIETIDSDSLNEGGYLCRHMMTAFVFGRTRAAVDKAVENVKLAFGRHNLSYHVEGATVESLYLQMFPPTDPTVRVAGAPTSGGGWLNEIKLFTHNVSGLVSFETPTQGLTTCDWGPKPVTMFRTARGSPYGFCWHVTSDKRAAGHCLVVGMTGSGKTVLMNFLGFASLGYEDAHVFFLDRGRGAYVPVKAFGGEYLHIAMSKRDALLNPFDLDLNEHGKWMVQWLQNHIVKDSSHPVTEALERIVGTLKKLPLEQRSFDEIRDNWPPDLGMQRSNIERFCTDGEYGGVFAAKRDVFAQTKNRLVGIDLGGVLDDPLTTEAVLPYLMYRIEKMMSRSGKPWLVILDEAPAMWRSDAMREWTKTMLQEARKNRGVLVLGIQRAGNLAEHRMEDLVTQCPSRFLFPLDELGEDYRSVFGLDQGDMDVLAGSSPSVERLNRYAVLKREGAGTAVLDIDLSTALKVDGRGDYLNLFRSGISEAQHVDALADRIGDDWVQDVVVKGYPR